MQLYRMLMDVHAILGMMQIDDLIVFSGLKPNQNRDCLN